MWDWWCILYLLLMLTGYQLTGPEAPVPSRVLCTIQAALIYVIPSSATFATCGIVGQIASLLLEILYEKPGLSRKVSCTLLFIPVVGYVTIFFISLSVGIDNPLEVKRNVTGAYCNISHPLPFVVSAKPTLAAFVLMMLLEFFTIVLLWKHRTWVKHMKTGSAPIPISLFIRLVCLSVGQIAGTIFSISSIGSESANGPYENPAIIIFTAAVPVIEGIALGTQRDILGVWMFCKKPSYMPGQSSEEAAITLSLKVCPETNEILTNTKKNSESKICRGANPMDFEPSIKILKAKLVENCVVGLIGTIGQRAGNQQIITRLVEFCHRVKKECKALDAHPNVAIDAYWLAPGYILISNRFL
ncbi:hypothetical protein DL96DRAFT_1563190 [Flagelloscypha sp. PMI_526]|nr:hypothetical protein DL96DRAFT_1563190 [Flagelloscypha sp. PMI_526]